jgi:hypothetical protein
MKEFLVTGYHLHDCHVTPMIFLVITIRAIKVNIVKLLITSFCYFFAKISHKVIDNYGLGSLWESGYRLLPSLRFVSLHHVLT